jgi:hypothetical protein
MSSFAKAPELVNVVASNLTSQFDSLEDSLLPSNDSLVDAARLLPEKMIGGGIQILHREGQKLKTYLDERYDS